MIPALVIPTSDPRHERITALVEAMRLTHQLYNELVDLGARDAAASLHDAAFKISREIAASKEESGKVP